MKVFLFLLSALLVILSPAHAMPFPFGNPPMPTGPAADVPQPPFPGDFTPPGHFFLGSPVPRATCSLDDNYNAWCRVKGPSGFSEGWLCDQPCIPHCSQSRCPGGTECISIQKGTNVCPTGGPNKCTLDNNYDAFCRAKGTRGKFGAWQCDKPCIPYCAASTCPNGMVCNAVRKGDECYSRGF